ncbi:MAG: hypothetical protein KAW51_08525 [Candidatus Lokiarchaeota archaeon]|nr:hypothetical protein [Candidatus Lokiarchaeota archaeon]
MSSNFIIKDQDSYEPVSVVKCYFAKDNQKTVLIKLPNGKIVCVPKTTIQSDFLRYKNVLQEIIIDDWILRKLGLI